MKRDGHSLLRVINDRKNPASVRKTPAVVQIRQLGGKRGGRLHYIHIYV